jgi:hypothetical protein
MAAHEPHINVESIFAAIHAPTTMANNHSTAIVQRLWNYCNVLRGDGVSYGDYVEQLIGGADRRAADPDGLR